MPDEALDVDYMMENVWIVGDPQECADQIRALYEEVGRRLATCWPSPRTPTTIP